jgi:putative nucleotide binding protein
MEDYIYILDSIPYGTRYRGQPYIEGVGDKFFALLEVTLKEGSSAVVGEKLYIGKDISQRNKAEKIKRRINYDELSTAAKENLFEMLKKIVLDNQAKFINFVNTAGPISVRVHQLELIPGVGKKNMEFIIQEREKSAFKDFDDIHKRIGSWQDPIGSFAYRIIEEMRGKERHYFFVLPQRE